ncbi:MAG: hypothetical protein QOJ29_3323 [Thermoleophilaceae bacterium]|jgi:hypothetical protein|nr:hypothetical protein [Thermoleophilaceae bacterium]
MFVVIFLLLGLSFGYALRLPWALLALLIPAALALAANNRSGSAMVVGFITTVVGILVGLVLATRSDEQHA